MLSIGKVGGGDADPGYYLDTVASGAEDYYTGRGEAPGQWAGVGAGARGLTGTVEDDAFLARLTADVGPGKKVLAYDLTFSAPKSVSVLYGLGDEHVSATARDAHDQAVQQALGYLERHACWTRRGAGGRDVTRGDGLTVALFRHRSSRAGDPQLHTHSVVVNATTDDGRTTALDGRALYAHARTAGFLYEAALRDELTRRLGVEWEPVRNGIAEIAGIDAEVLRRFSQRRDEILAHMERRGSRSARSAQIAALETRRAKDYNVPAARLRDEWRTRASELGFGPAEIGALLDRAGVEERGARRQEHEIAADLGAAHGVTRDASTFDRRDVLREVAAAHRNGATVAEVEALADRWLTSPEVVCLEPGAQRQQLGGARYSTRDMLDVERRIVHDAAVRRGSGVATVPPETVEAVLAESTETHGEQADLVRRVTQSGDGVQVIRAPAGTGKTRALAVARDAWERNGTPVYGCALAARAAVELETTAGIDSTTIARLLQDVERGHSLPPGSVLVVDEAGMVGSRTVDRLAQHTAAVDAKLLLVGDDRQLPEIDAGGAFRGLADRLGAVELKTVRRQAEQWDRDALANLRAGKLATSADSYREHGRIVAAPTADATRTALVADWWQAAQVGNKDAVMIAHRRAEVRELNALGRARMRFDGRLGNEELVADGRPFAVGDRVLARRNDRRAGVVNGMRARVVGVDLDAGSLTIQPDDGEARTLDRRYLDEGWLEHGYALTAHAAQGATVDRAFVLGSDELYREWGYTALSRHRAAAHFYVVSPGSAEHALPGLDPPPDALGEDLTAMLAPSRRKTMAIDVAGERPAPTVAWATRASASRPEPADVAAEEIEAARARIAALTEEREGLRLWQRSKRNRVDALLRHQEESIARWEAEPTTQRGTVQPATRARTIEESAHPPAELRAFLLDPPSTLTARIGERPDTLRDREKWCRAASNLMGRDDGPPTVSAELDTLADIGPEL